MENLTSSKGVDLIKYFEGLHLKAYMDPVGIPTIGYGNIIYETGKKVSLGDVITLERANFLLQDQINKKAAVVAFLVKGYYLKQNQFDSLVSFAYNLGVGALSGSTLLKKVKANPDDTSIRGEFMKWVNAGGKQLKGLVIRRKAEADLYFLK